MVPYKIILASQSPRRQSLLDSIGIAFRVMLPEADENFPPDLPVRMVPAYLSEKKARSLEHLMKFDELVIAADTIVLLNGEIYGKPIDEQDARNLLHLLSGNMHEVISGVTLLTRDKCFTFSEVTKVFFRRLTDEMIDYYVEKFKPFDKAGAYAIQEWIGLVGIEKINGCFYNVMGLPVSRVVQELRMFGIDVTQREFAAD